MVILQTQSTAGAALEIIIMLLGAAIIGVLTTYFYMKSKYQKIINSLEAKLNEAQRENSRLNSELDAKNDQYQNLEKKYEELLKKEENLKKAASKGRASNKKLKETEEELKEREELLKRISERKHMMDYARIGTARSEDKDDLKMISGIGPHIEEQLHALDIFTFEQISKFEKEDIAAVREALDYFPGRIERDEWVAQAKELVYTGGEKSEVLENIASRKNRINYDRIGIAHKEDAQDLTAIDGIGGWIQEKLYALDIFTYKQIARLSEEDINSLTEVIEFFPGRIERDEWVKQAKELAG
jgi:predicted flap endonuclease-1-like 5' DNA nuclease